MFRLFINILSFLIGIFNSEDELFCFKSLFLGDNFLFSSIICNFLFFESLIFDSLIFDSLIFGLLFFGSLFLSDDYLAILFKSGLALISFFDTFLVKTLFLRTCLPPNILLFLSTLLLLLLLLMSTFIKS